MHIASITAIAGCFNGDDTCITRQVAFDGFVQGLTYGLLALGIVLIYRSTRVINFAVGNMGLPGAVLFALLIRNYGVPFWLAVPLCLVAGALLGAVVELAIIRRLFTSPRVVVLMATVGIAQLMQAVVTALPEVNPSAGGYPLAISGQWQPISDLRVSGAKLTVLIVVPLVAVGLGLLMNRTIFGKAVAASASNPSLSRLCGVNPKVISTAVWTIGGLLATLTMMLLGGINRGVTGLDSLGPLTLTRALAAAVIAGMSSFPRAAIAGLAIGVVEATVRFNYLFEPGLVDFLLLIAVLIAVYFQTRRTEQEGAVSFIPKVRPVPASLRDLWYVRHLGKLIGAAALALVIALPLVIDIPNSRLLLYSSIVGFAVAATSVTVITGWAGQLSLAQMTFAGFGALLAAAFSRGLEMNVGWRSMRVLDFQLKPVPFIVAILLATATTAVLAVVIGLGALRVRGLLLAVTTFTLAVAGTQYLYGRPILSNGQSSVLLRRGSILGIDLESQQAYFYFSVAVLTVALLVLSRMRRSGVGRRLIAVRDNPDCAAAYTINPARAKLTAFILAGSIASLAGGLLGGLVENIIIEDNDFSVAESLDVVAMVVIGGLGSIAGPVVGALWVEGLPSFWPNNSLVPLLSSSIGMLFILLYFPGGITQIGFRAREAVFERLEARRPAAPVAKPRQVAVVARPDRNRDLPDTVLRCRDVSVHFNGNRAVNSVDLDVGRDEIVGLIGTNGAGKSTLLNAIGGYVPASGSVELRGEEIADRAAHRRAAAGIGRTFQSASLFPELTVRESVQVALEARRRSGVLRTALHLDGPVESKQRREAAELIDFLGLSRYAESYIADLSTGTRRIVGLANLLAVDASVLCLDEPTAGVAQREAEAFGPLLKRIRTELGASMIIVEHDMPLIMSLSDRIYCLESGNVIAVGTPAEVRSNPLVVASYLGTDSRAIDRSDSGDLTNRA
ncbi:MAG: ATP-binding cassette domain-containing protein [Actinomycetota bacterium]